MLTTLKTDLGDSLHPKLDDVVPLKLGNGPAIWNVVDVDNCHHVLLDEELVSGDQKSNFLLYKW